MRCAVLLPCEPCQTNVDFRTCFFCVDQPNPAPPQESRPRASLHRKITAEPVNKKHQPAQQKTLPDKGFRRVTFDSVALLLPVQFASICCRIEHLYRTATLSSCTSQACSNPASWKPVPEAGLQLAVESRLVDSGLGGRLVFVTNCLYETWVNFARLVRMPLLTTGPDTNLAQTTAAYSSLRRRLRPPSVPEADAEP